MDPQDVYSAEDLTNWSAATKDLSPPAKLAVFGDPVEHSKSPQMHNAALKEAGIKMQYVRVHVKPDELKNALAGVRDAGFVGVNLTIPHKAAALEIVDEVDPRAAQLGGVNTVALRDGKMIGFNTDGGGFVRAIRQEFSVDLRNLRIVVLGAGGGAGRAIATQCALEGCDRLVLFNRTHERAVSLARSLAPLFSGPRLLGPAAGLSAPEWEDSNLKRDLDQADLIVNCTSVGLAATDPDVIPAEFIMPYHLVFDTVYRSGRTRLVKAAQRAGARASDGLPLLLHQGALSFEIWFGREAPVDAMQKALTEAVEA
jgi:shikimate dehydrogenase